MLSQLVKELLRKASKADKPVHMTEVNYAEAKYMILRKNGADAWAEAAKILIALPIEFHAADRELADVAADFKSRFSLRRCRGIFIHDLNSTFALLFIER